MQTPTRIPLTNPKSEIAASKSTGPKSRAAFTLVEMLVVIMIIAVLAGLLLPALNRARITANEAKVIAEIKQLEAGIAAFKAKYGVEPPSQIVLYTTAAGWNTSQNPSCVTSMAIIRQMWPQFDFTYSTGTPFPPFWTTIATKTQSDPNPALRMNSGECLLFFLGGIIPSQNNGNLSVTVPQGFAKNPVAPFSPPTVSANREGPFFEFSDLKRISDLDSNGINEWYDALPGQSKPYLYFSSYEGRGYNTFEVPNNGTAFSGLQDMYRVWSGSVTQGSFPLPPATPSSSTAGTSAALPAQKPQSFQIISPGYDTNYGVGGVFNPTLANSGLVKGFDSKGNPIYDTDAYDNLTNFNAGRLNP